MNFFLLRRRERKILLWVGLIIIVISFVKFMTQSG